VLLQVFDKGFTLAPSTIVNVWYVVTVHAAAVPAWRRHRRVLVP
jgi:hypothetical protein